MTSKDPLGHLPSRRSPRQKNKELNHLEANEASHKPVEKIESAMLIFRSSPTIEEWNKIVAATKNAVALTGNIASRPAGPVVGLVDIGYSDHAYLFMISLPGVSRDEICCEIGRNGKVLVKGISLTGQKKVCISSQIFEMQTQNLPPPGPFSISFQLPGPVEPRGFIGNFRNDGIFEGIVLRGDLHDHNEVEVEDNVSAPVK
ncbi:hypothetical protein ACHQM5_025973 [Ranunculus cassubicifolius]